MSLSAKAAFAAMALFGMAMPAAAATIDFNNLARNGTGFRYLPDHAMTFGDYVFTAQHSLASPYLVFDRNSPINADPGGATFAHQWSGTTMTLARTDGELFDLAGFNFTDLFNNGAAATQILLFDYGNGQQETRSFTSDALAGMQFLPLFRTRLRQVSFTPTGGGGWWQIDNVTVDVSAVPEPSSWAMMIMGTFGIGASLRRRQRQLSMAQA